MIFLDIFCFWVAKMLFAAIFVFSILYLISVIFLCFLYREKFAILAYNNLVQLFMRWVQRLHSNFPHQWTMHSLL